MTMDDLKVQSHVRPADVNCGGQSVPAYWVATVECRDGSFIAGTGDNKEEAEARAIGQAIKHNLFLSGGPRERLRALLANAGPGGLLSSDVTRAIQAIAEIIL